MREHKNKVKIPILYIAISFITKQRGQMTFLKERIHFVVTPTICFLKFNIWRFSRSLIANPVSDFRNS